MVHDLYDDRFRPAVPELQQHACCHIDLYENKFADEHAYSWHGHYDAHADGDLYLHD
jgi:hypothetical protein